jgi:probable phosphoglycerate mutase
MTHKLQFDGGSRGNPGIGGSGSVIYDVGSGKVVWKGYHFLGMSVTNNQAEYAGLIEGLKAAVALKISSLEIEGDSELVVRQMTGEYKVKNAQLIVLQKKAQDLVTKIPEHSFKSIPRSLNAEADQLSNLAMDTRKSESMLYKVS